MRRLLLLLLSLAAALPAGAVEYRTVDELKQAIAEVEAAMHKDAVATGLYPRAPRQIRVTTGKGF